MLRDVYVSVCVCVFLRSFCAPRARCCLLHSWGNLFGHRSHLLHLAELRAPHGYVHVQAQETHTHTYARTSRVLQEPKGCCFFLSHLAHCIALLSHTTLGRRFYLFHSVWFFVVFLAGTSSLSGGVLWRFLRCNLLVLFVGLVLLVCLSFWLEVGKQRKKNSPSFIKVAVVCVFGAVAGFGDIGVNLLFGQTHLTSRSLVFA